MEAPKKRVGRKVREDGKILSIYCDRAVYDFFQNGAYELTGGNTSELFNRLAKQMISIADLPPLQVNG